MKGFILAGLFTLPAAHALECAQWDRAVHLGDLDDMVHESSGMETSTLVPGRLYHTNDSGDGPTVYVTDAQGQSVRKVQVQDFDPKDTEDLSVGTCPQGTSSCLYLADIGDNLKRRSSIQIAILEEAKLGAKAARPLNVVKVRYPEGAQNAESMAVHPSGDAYIITKREGGGRIYRIPKANLMLKETTAELMGSVQFSDGDALATGMDISEDGSSFLLLTYQDVLHFNVDLSRMQKGRGLGREAQEVGIEALKKQEAVAFNGPKSFLYTTEGDSPLMRASCLR